jgi:hypothetical protein
MGDDFGVQIQQIYFGPAVRKAVRQETLQQAQRLGRRDRHLGPEELIDDVEPRSDHERAPDEREIPAAKQPVDSECGVEDGSYIKAGAVTEPE